ncbi:MAG: Maf family protein [Proteobacteria bacterium]|nr:Maf family protein [Pseudomonadota bacterium]
MVTEEGNFLQTNSSQVTFKDLHDDEIDSYLATGEADDKAGAYAIQGIAAQFVLRLDGSFSGVMGLPLYETVQLLKRCGLNPLAPVTDSHI